MNKGLLGTGLRALVRTEKRSRFVFLVWPAAQCPRPDSPRALRSEEAN